MVMVVSALLTHISCDDTETTNPTSFMLYYSGMTDIGPSMSGILSSPTYIGSEPSDFTITKITINEERYTGHCFVIDTKTGAIAIENTREAPVGLYLISVSCMSNGKLYEYNDIVEVNMMKPVPDGITVEPDQLQVEYADVIDPDSEVELPTAQVTTDGNHVSIMKYEIARSETSRFFSISSTGEISIVKGSPDILPGVYTISLKLTTGASGEDEGIFENALTVNVTSKPLALTYAPNTGKIEEESALSGKTTFTSNAPTLKGSAEGLTYSIKKVTPATDKIRIDARTGVLSVDAGHGLVAGSKFMIDVRVSNNFATEGVEFDEVFELEVVAFIEPVSNFSYANVEEIQAVEFEVYPDAAFKGDEVKFELVDLPAALQGELTVDIHGVVRAAKGNSIPLGAHTVNVQATNPKSDPQQPTIATFILTIKENPNYFTYVRYGNNLGLTPETNYANQFKMDTSHPLSGLLPETDAKVPLTYEIKGVHQGGRIKIDAVTGEVSANQGGSQCAIGIITATAGKGTKAEVSVKTPIFFFYQGAIKDNESSDLVEFLYSPFVFQVNPRNGGRSAVPTITGVSNPSVFTMDYRRNFQYYNYNGNHVEGVPATGNFMGYLWEKYAETIGSNVNYGGKAPLSYYENTKAGQSLDNALAYVDAADYSIVVNPNKWLQDGEYADGFMVGQITFSSKESNVNNGGQVFPIILWFGPHF
ncbi:MAG: DUF4958 family protein [Bacteroides sp.]|nr:DUF4958 family protein [Bacteroides sp.]